MHAESLRIEERVPLEAFTTLGIGGTADRFLEATTESQIAAAYALSQEEGLPILVLGGGSNLVVADEGFKGLVMRMAMHGITYQQEGDATLVAAAAGEPWDKVVEGAVEHGLAGIECLSGIPGTVGGTPIQNVGAYGQEVADTLHSVTAFDTTRGAMVTMTAGDCGFAYRTSRFKAEPGRFAVTGVTFRLQPGMPTPRYPDLLAWLDRAGIDQPALGDVRAAVIAVRRTKGMVVDAADPDSRSVGSFFMNPIVSVAVRDAVANAAGSRPPSFTIDERTVKIPAAWLIERAGFHKGFVDGAVGLSTKHPLAIVNRGGATARDVLRLALLIKRTVAEQFGVSLRPEPIFVGFGDDSGVAYLLQT